MFQIVDGLSRAGRVAAIEEYPSTVRVAELLEPGDPHITELLGRDVAGGVIRVVGDAELGDDAGRVGDLCRQHDGLGVVILARARTLDCARRVVHVSGADPAFPIRLQTLQRLCVEQDRAAHAAGVIQHFHDLASALHAVGAEQGD